MKTILRSFLAVVAIVPVLSSCQTPEETFIGSRLLSTCDDAYWICNYAAGCVLDGHHYVEGSFPGTRRVVVVTEKDDVKVKVRLFLSTERSPGTEILVQMHEPNCTIDPIAARAQLVDVDIFEEAGDDRTLTFELQAFEQGEHLLEIFSDASVEYLLIVAPR